MAINRDQLRALRLKAQGVVAAQAQASADMYTRVIDTGNKVAKVRDTAETAHMAELSAQIVDLTEMEQELKDFGNGVPLGSPGGATPLSVTAKPVTATDSALAALAGAQPGKLASDAWVDPNTPDGAYKGTHPDALKV